jgi:hypothetical protein
MRNVTYKTHWSYSGSRQRQGSLADFVLDIPYLIAENGVIPPLHIINQVLQTGGSSGGMSPGTTWKAFQIDEPEYHELVQALLHLDIQRAHETHPYIRFDRIVIDMELDNCPTHLDWLTKAQAKYGNYLE